MDYLTILATWSLILFSPPKSVHHHDSNNSSPNTTPSTPVIALPNTAPSPISMPIQSLMEGKADCVYFLLTHVLATPNHESEITPGSPGGGGLGGTPKELVSEAEILVWKEMDKAKMFARELGAWFSGHGNSRMSEGALERLAEKWGLKMLPVEGQDEAVLQSEKSQVSLRSFHEARQGVHA